jgi:nitrogen fixation protein FixH
MVDLLFARHRHSTSSERSVIGWLVLNMLVLFVGWIVITIGATQLVD